MSFNRQVSRSQPDLRGQYADAGSDWRIEQDAYLSSLARDDDLSSPFGNRVVNFRKESLHKSSSNSRSLAWLVLPTTVEAKPMGVDDWRTAGGDTATATAAAGGHGALGRHSHSAYAEDEAAAEGGLGHWFAGLLPTRASPLADTTGSSLGRDETGSHSSEGGSTSSSGASAAGLARQQAITARTFGQSPASDSGAYDSADGKSPLAVTSVFASPLASSVGRPAAHRQQQQHAQPAPTTVDALFHRKMSDREAYRVLAMERPW